MKYPDIKVKLVGEDGNAFRILGAVSQELRRHQVSEEEIRQYRSEATSGDYDHLLQVTMAWVDII